MRLWWLSLGWLLLWPAGAGAVHIAWMAPFRDAHGVSCCERTDCRPANVTVLHQRRGEVLVDGVPLTLPPGSVHRIPHEAHEPDAVGFWCYRGDPRQVTAANSRCIFYKTPFW